ncbi:long-chain fatty acid--CoA ligase, partial [Methylobacterium frigidaeris]
VYYVVLPLFHANGLFMQVGGCLIAGATAMVRQRFSATAWLRDIRATGATATNTLGVLSAFVFEQPPGPDDRDHRLRLILAAPNVPEHEAIWKSRFGVETVVSGFGMTEVNIVVWGSAGASRPGTSGRVYDRHFEVEIHDPETDTRRDPGRIGEIVVRPRTPFGFMAGYDGMPEKTVEAWRNLWFRTGDAGI